MTENKGKNGAANGTPKDDDDDDYDFSTGRNRLEKAAERSKAGFDNYKLGGAFREFWLSAEKEALVRFLTDEAYALGRHAIYRNGKWEKYVCRSSESGGDPNVCPMCAAGIDLRDEGAHLLIDRRQFPGKDGKVHSNELKILCLAASHIVKIHQDCDESEDRNLKREWKMKRTGEKSKTVYSIYPKPTNPIPEDEKKIYKVQLVPFIEAWEKYKKKTGKEIPLERFVVAKCLKRMSKEDMQRLIDEIGFSQGGKQQQESNSQGGDEKTAASGKEAEYREDDFSF